jgi:uncharacterized protein (DUF1800 family)
MLQQITVVARDAVFNPIPAPLPARKRKKSATLAAERQGRKELKDRLRHRRKGQIIEMDAHQPKRSIDDSDDPIPGGTIPVKPERVNQKLIRRQKKSN